MPSFVISGLISLVVLLLTSIAGALNEFADGPRDARIANALNAFATGLQALASQAAGVEGAGETGGTGEQPGQGTPTPAFIRPIPQTGERSDAFAARYPEGLPCDVALGLKYDPWRVLETPAGFVRGAWIPVDAPYTLPVND